MNTSTIRQTGIQKVMLKIKAAAQRLKDKKLFELWYTARSFYPWWRVP